MQISLVSLRNAVEKTLDHLEESGLTHIDVDEDYYWNIVKEQIYDPYKEPTDLNIGQLSDDIEAVEKIASGKHDPIGYDLVWIAAIMRYIGENNSI